MRAAKAERHAKALRIAHAHICPPLARRHKQRERQQIRRRNNERAAGVGACGNIVVVVHAPLGARILQQHREDFGTKRRSACVAHHHGPPTRPRTRSDDVDGLRVAGGIDEHRRLSVPGLDGVRHGQRFGGRGPLIQQRRVGDLQTGEVCDHGLIVQECFESPLRNLRLVRRVRGVPAGVLKNVALNHRRNEGVVVAQPDVRTKHLVLVGYRAEFVEHIVLRSCRPHVERATKADVLGNRCIHELVERVISKRLEHRVHVGPGRSDVPTNERVRIKGEGSHASRRHLHPKHEVECPYPVRPKSRAERGAPPRY